jgi:glycosyltransferase involved in cell wall biosynthesis
MKDYPLVRRVADALAVETPERAWVLLLAGEDEPRERRDGPLLEKALPFCPDPGAMARCYHAADLVLHATHSESWGRVVTEAMACGRAVVATALPPIAGQVEDGVSGMLSPAGDEAMFREACRRLLADDALRGAVEVRAAARARERFSLDRQAERYLALYGELAGAEPEGAA